MKIFSSYAHYYDLLYCNKDYQAEADFVHNLLQKYASKTKTILELGCGTGIHAVSLAKKGYNIRGIDISKDMLKQANKRCSRIPKNISKRLSFSHGDIRKVRLEQRYDAVIGLFHVISYQTTNSDLISTFDTVSKHLKPGGTFIFDCWYGPAVLTKRPEVRIKRIENEQIRVVRIAEPVMHYNENVVDVNYQVFIKNKKTEVIEELKEKHRMRYFFKPELNLFLKKKDMQILHFREWMTNREVGINTWGVYSIVKA